MFEYFVISDGWSGDYTQVSGGENISVNGQSLTVIFAPVTYPATLKSCVALRFAALLLFSKLLTKKTTNSLRDTQMAIWHCFITPLAL